MPTIPLIWNLKRLSTVSVFNNLQASRKSPLRCCGEGTFHRMWDSAETLRALFPFQKLAQFITEAFDMKKHTGARAVVGVFF